MVKVNPEMRSLWLINKARFQTNWRSYLQITVSLLLTTLCLALSLQLFTVLEKPFDATFEKLKASHLLLLFEDTNRLGEKLSDWFTEQEEIQHTGALQSCRVIAEPFLHRGNKLDVAIQITERIVDDATYDQLKILKGKASRHPEIGEIWLPYHFETMQGIQLGDTLGIPAQGDFYRVTVSAFVVDPHYLSNLFNPTRAWVAPGALSFFLPVQDMNQTTVGIRLKDPQLLDALWERFSQHFDYSGINLRYTIFRSAFSGFSTMMSIVLLVFGLLLLIISLLIIRTTIASNILANYQQIGVLKSLGFTKNHIVCSYLLQSFILLLMAVPPGLWLSRIIMDVILGTTLQKIGLADLLLETTYPLLVSSSMVILLVMLISYITSREAGKVDPMVALRDLKKRRANSSRGTVINLEGRSPLSLWLAIRFIQNALPGSVALTLGFLATFAMVLFAVNLFSSFDQLGQNKTAWGFDESDLIVNRQSAVILPLTHEALLEGLNNQPGAPIKTIIPYRYLTAHIVGTDYQKQQLFGKVYTDSLSKAGLTNITGKHPVEKEEVALGLATAKDHGKAVGDSVTLEIEGFKKAFRISGIYQDISAFGQGFRLAQNAILLLNPLFEPTSYGLVLRDDVEINSFKNELLEQFGETITVEGSIESRTSIIGLLANLKMALFSLSLLFTIILLVLIGNDITIQTRQNEVVYAQLKSIGFHTRELRSIILIRVLILFALGLLLSLPIGFLAGHPLARALASGLGLQQFPFFISWSSILGVYGLLLLFVWATSWFSSRLIRKINPRKLVAI